jgi:hypothetical protein
VPAPDGPDLAAFGPPQGLIALSPPRRRPVDGRGGSARGRSAAPTPSGGCGTTPAGATEAAVRCGRPVTALRRTAGRVFRWCCGPDAAKRPVVVPFVLGVLLVAVSYVWYNAVAPPPPPPPSPPSVPGTGEVFVDDDGVAVVMGVAVRPDAPHAPGRWPVRITLTFVRAPSASQTSPTAPTARAVRWAIVLHDDARLADGTPHLPPGAALTSQRIGSPLFVNALVRDDTQVIQGTAYLTVLGNRAQAVVVSGDAVSL